MDHPYIEGGQEINGVSGDVRPSLFRAMLFSPLECIETAAAEMLKCMVGFAASLSLEPLLVYARI